MHRTASQSCSRANAGPAYLELPDGHVHLLAGGEQTVGRQGDNQLVVREPTVSRRHAYLKQVRHFWLVYDQGSANGTWVNGARVENLQILRDGDVLRVGAFTCTFRAPHRRPAPRRAAA